MHTKLFNKVLIFMPVLLVLACSTTSPKPAPSEADIQREEQAIYSSFFKDAKGLVILLQDTSSNISEDSSQQTIDYIKSDLKGISKETLDSYLARNAQPGQLPPDMNLGVNYILLGSDELSEISSQPNWGELLAKKYPGSYGYTIFSRVGFNNSLDQAIIYVGSVGGPMMGSGFYDLMEKKNGKWEVKEQVMAWIS